MEMAKQRAGNRVVESRVFEEVMEPRQGEDHHRVGKGVNFAGRIYEIVEMHKCKSSIGCANYKPSFGSRIFCFEAFPDSHAANQGRKPPGVWKTLLRVIHSVDNSTGEVVKGAPLVKAADDLFWFNRPRLLPFLIHLVLFQNSFQLAFFSWSTVSSSILDQVFLNFYLTGSY
ncbi:hypothetical protein Fmac_017606 [Flemingia macrophylla]|uniref:Uncharacterized protein n=1 Tax=Flemingia macrophylla TaxID=520843 RepID=A0ABD1M2M0_9FABA